MEHFLKDINSDVAIKRISEESRPGVKEYATEVKIISQLRRRNLVQFNGWCHLEERSSPYMPNGSLGSHLHHERASLHGR